MLQYIKEKLYVAWEGTKAWFKRSQVIFLARLEAAVGFVIAALAFADWGPLLSSGITWAQATTLGAIMFIKGIITEWARRINTVVVKDQLIPKDITVKEVKAVQDIKSVEKKQEK